MGDLKADKNENREAYHQTMPHQATKSPARRRYLAIALSVLLLAMAAAAVAWWHKGAPNNDKELEKSTFTAAAPMMSDVIDLTVEQMKQINVEAVSERVVDLNLETTGKVSFNEDRLTP